MFDDFQLFIIFVKRSISQSLTKGYKLFWGFSSLHCSLLKYMCYLRRNLCVHYFMFFSHSSTLNIGKGDRKNSFYVLFKIMWGYSGLRNSLKETFLVRKLFLYLSINQLLCTLLDLICSFEFFGWYDYHSCHGHRIIT